MCAIYIGFPEINFKKVAIKGYVSRITCTLSFSFRAPGMSDSVPCTWVFQINQENDKTGHEKVKPLTDIGSGNVSEYVY